MPRRSHQPKPATPAYLAQALQYTEENTLLYPASYNRLGLLGDFEVMGIEDNQLYRLSGRVGPYTSIREWLLDGAGKSILGKDPEYCIAVLRPDFKQGSGASGDFVLVYRVAREDAQNLEQLAKDLQPMKDKRILVL